MSYIARMNDILTEDLVALANIETTEIALIDNGSNGVTDYALIMGQLVDGEFSVSIEEFFTDRTEALREFIILVQCEAGIDLEEEEV